MTELLTAAQMRAVEAAAIASGRVTGLDLMERAGTGVVDAVFREWPDLAAPGGGAAPTPPGYFRQDEATPARRAVVLCGPGNNGGDGFVIARLLKARGWEVAVFLLGDPSRLPPDARANHARWRAMGEVGALKDARIRNCDLVVDAIFGTGLGRPFVCPPSLREGFREVLTGGAGQPRVVAVDNVSSLDADSGRVLGDLADGAPALGAHLTVTFHRAKVGHHLAAAPWASPKLAVVDIGLDPDAQGPGAGTIRLAGCPDVSRLTKGGRGAARPGDVHKYGYGHALVIAGPSGHGGAARLAARGALRIGTGVVTVGCAPGAIPENAARLDAVMLKPVADAAALAAVLEDRRINALCLGPGMGTGPREAGLVRVALAARGTVRTILDADALTILAREPGLLGALHAGCVLTPHAGEFARLFPDIAQKLDAPATRGPAFSKVDATREAAARAGCVVLFKGSDTVISDPSGRCSIHSAHYERAAPWLATAGAGDVLAGFIAGLLARGLAPMEAAETAAWLHVECARRFGPGLISEDLAEELPEVLRALGA